MKNSINPNPSGPNVETPANEGVFDRLFSKRWFALTVSIIISVTLYLSVISQEPTQTRTLTVSTIAYDYNSALYTGASLDIVKYENDAKINVVISGDSSAINAAENSDVIVYPDYSDISRSGTPGEYSLRLLARRADSALAKFEIDSISPAYVKVTFAKIDTKKFNVEVEAQVDPAEGYYLGEKQVAPGEVTLRGPVEQLDRVDRVVARVESEEKRDRTMLDSAPLEFFDRDGNPVENADITVLEGDQVEVTIPILKIKTVPLKFEFNNIPQGYDPMVLRPSIYPETIRIAGPAEKIDSIESITAGYINLARLQLGRSESLKIQLPEGVVNVDDVQEATVSFDTIGYGEPRVIPVTDIRVQNVPAGVDIKVITESLNNVILLGEAKELEDISPLEVIATVDASAQNITVKGDGQQQLGAQIVVTGTKTVFAVGSYSVLCDITVKS